MGTWGTGLYSNDQAMDIRDAAQLVFSKFSPEHGTQRIADYYLNNIAADDMDQLAEFWYALADWQWNKGILQPIVKATALDLLSKNAGMEIWIEEGNKKDIRARQSVLQKLKEKLTTPPPAPKKISSGELKPQYKIGQILTTKLDFDVDLSYVTENYKQYIADSFVTKISKGYYIAMICVAHDEHKTEHPLGDSVDVVSSFAFYDYAEKRMPTVDELKTLGFLNMADYDFEKEDFRFYNELQTKYFLYGAAFFYPKKNYLKLAVSQDEVNRFQKIIDTYSVRGHQMSEIGLAISYETKRLAHHLGKRMEEFI